MQEKQQEAVVERCREAYLSMLQRNAAGRVMSHRARSHLRQACLAAATHKVLLEEAPVSPRAFGFWWCTVARVEVDQSLSHRARQHLRQACLPAASLAVLLSEAPVGV